MPRSRGYRHQIAIAPPGSVLFSSSGPHLAYESTGNTFMLIRRKTMDRGRGLFVLRIAMSAFMLVFAVAAFTPTHGFAQDRTDEGASIRFVHASPDGGNIDVIVDGAVVVENIAFGDASDYLPTSSGKHQVQIVPTGSTAESALLDDEVDLDSGAAYIFAATGLLNDLQSKLYEVDLDDLDENQARVRLLNLAPDEDSIALAVSGGDEWHDDVSFPDASDY
ncbi:MAG: DUF4397 domain-containing protein, partial [Thermomicrobiales bacterium]